MSRDSVDIGGVRLLRLDGGLAREAAKMGAVGGRSERRLLLPVRVAAGTLRGLLLVLVESRVGRIESGWMMDGGESH